MNRDERMIHLAAKMAEKSQHRFRVGSVIAIGNRIIGFGVNKYRTHPRQMNWHRNQCANSIHAELDGVISSSHTANSTIYIARILKDGSWGLAKPCSECQKIIELAGIKRVVYTIRNGLNYYNVR